MGDRSEKDRRRLRWGGQDEKGGLSAMKKKDGLKNGGYKVSTNLGKAGDHQKSIPVVPAVSGGNRPPGPAKNTWVKT